MLAKVSTSIEREAAWLYKAGWPLYALVDKYSAGAPLDEQGNCLATAVYFEARGESLEGQLAVARVVMNRAASGRYPSDWCSVVKQPWQFSFVRNGQFPAVNEGSAAWARAQGVARLAMANVVPSVDSDVLWYHADLCCAVLGPPTRGGAEDRAAPLLPQLIRTAFLPFGAGPHRSGDNFVHMGFAAGPNGASIQVPDFIGQNPACEGVAGC